ncbi:glycoside hydrolase family 31 protein [Amniculicola lignicola CBS 123094]|uniref:alpha-glucosidase n=1 Tax=Amniculicola lignicola CBS 123094 TaxID=1392246 RepID=A0A6A5WHN3_9PLEO|nr:glycoside hydrolase family 31 protein [Amniculicola lignicola CBS 123094]
MSRYSFFKRACVSASFLALTGGQSPSSTDGVARPIFTIPASADEGANLIPNILDPQAVNAQDVCPGYRASDAQEDGQGLTATLTLAGPACNVYGTDIETLKLRVEYQAASRLAINISPANIDSTNSSHYIIPEDLIPRPQPEASYGGSDLKFAWGNNPSFWFSVTRQSTGDVLFTTKDKKLVYENQFIEFASALPEDYNLYGLGERIHGLRLGNNFTATIYAADVGDPIDRNLYGSHPFYLDTRYYETGSKRLVKNAANPGKGHNGHHGEKGSGGGAGYESRSHGVYLRNLHGQEVLLQPDSITWRTLGGSIDLFFFEGPSQVEVTKQYQISAIGLPALQPYWGFGYHQCRWGYQNWTVLRGVIDDMKAFNIPLETIWVDIDYMDQYRDFTLDPNTFKQSEVKAFFDRLHDDDQHFVPIVDSAIYIPNPNNASDAYDTYTRGNSSGAFLNNPDGSQYIGAVWPGYTVFPDWLAESGQPWWVNEMVEWHKEVPYDGIWIDMSEVSSFCVGSCGTGNVTMNPVHPPFALPGEKGNVIYEYPEGFNITNATEAASASAAASSQAAAMSTADASSTAIAYLRTTPTQGVRDVNYPPYVIDNVQGDLAVHAVSPNATHHNGVEEYDVHNIFGHQILNATYQGLLSVFPGKRPFIIGRSTFAGSGKWAGHWGGDNASKWYYMYFSIPQALSFSLFGIPMFGVDTCGFNGNTDAELCSRWMQLSAFFPFYRNHNTLSANPQEPYRWETVATASRTAMHIRYTLLPYIYTLFYHAHTTGSTVMRAVSWEFPHDPSLADIDTQFLLGPSLLVIPVLQPQATSVTAVFPGLADGASWYDWYSQTRVDAQAYVNTSIAAPLGHIPVFVRGGSVLPTQDPGYTTSASRRNAWGLIVALDGGGEAGGDLYVDDGEAVDPGRTRYVSFSAGEGRLVVHVEGEYVDGNVLGNVTVLGVGSLGSVRWNGVEVEVEGGMVRYDEQKEVLVVGLRDVTRDGAWRGGWTLSWK